MLSTIQISGEDSRQFYHNALLMKISDLKRFRDTIKDIPPAPTDTTRVYLDNDKVACCAGIDKRNELGNLIHHAESFRNLFNIKNTVITLTIIDVDLLTRILDTQA